MRGFLSGRQFDADDMMAVADDEWLPVGEASAWTFDNDGLGMAMAHPIHVHGVQFRVIERDRAAAPAGLRVRLQVAPTVSGLFVYHCHNLEHEDGGMMRNCLFSERRASKRAG